MPWTDWRVWLGCGAAICGAAFLGYCVYFDKKRRSDPDYRKRVMEKRKKQKSRQDFPEGTDGPVGPGGDVIDLRDPQARKEFLMQQMKLANQKMLENNLPEAISHLINFVSLSGNPQEALAALQQSLPPTIFQLLVQTISKLGEEHLPGSTLTDKLNGGKSGSGLEIMLCRGTVHLAKGTNLIRRMTRPPRMPAVTL